MINVQEQPEPDIFEQQVRRPGNNRLARNPPTRASDIKNFWKNVREPMHSAYNGICAYTCMYMMPYGSIDHFIPKALDHSLAYEWSNYRLATERVNRHKDASIRIIDPFLTNNNWFEIDFPSCLVKPAPNLSNVITTQIENTIEDLKLNIDDVFVQERCNLMMMLTQEEITLGFLNNRYPFLAKEVVRQNIADNLTTIFRMRGTNG